MALLAITPLDVAFVTSFAAIAAPLSAWLIARSQRGAERRARTYSDKSAAYRRVLVDTYGGRAILETCIRELEASDDDDGVRQALQTLGTALEADIEAENERLADLALVAPEQVVNRHADFIATWNTFIDRLRTIPQETTAKHNVDLRTDATKLVTDWLTEITGKVTQLRQAIRDDLTG